jgi:hypothetical protein
VHGMAEQMEDERRSISSCRAYYKHLKRGVWPRDGEQKPTCTRNQAWRNEILEFLIQFHLQIWTGADLCSGPGLDQRMQPQSFKIS